MNTTPRIRRTFSSLLIAAMTLAGSQVAFAGSTPTGEDRQYVDPLTGEVKQATKLLSEMTDAERSALSNEEYKALKDLEDKLKRRDELDMDSVGEE
jgi:hypothetical protein